MSDELKEMNGKCDWLIESTHIPLTAKQMLKENRERWEQIEAKLKMCDSKKLNDTLGSNLRFENLDQRVLDFMLTGRMPGDW